MKIHFAADASETILFAAEELSGYLKKMADGLERTEWEVALERDDSLFPGSRKDGYRIEIGPKGGRIAGKNDRSVLLAVYDYLHHLGCRFLMPQKKCEIIPYVSREELAAVYEKEASYFHRGVCIEGADSLENILDYIAWLPKMGYNSFFLQFKSPYAFMSHWYSHAENPYAQAQPYTQEDACRDMARLEREIKKRGLLLHKAGHGWTGEALGYQTVSWDVGEKKEEELFTDRMAMIDGKRGLFHGIPANTNLCYANGQAKEAFVSLVVSYAQENPQMDYLHVWLADNYNNLCECPACKATTLADQYVELLNEMDQRLTAAGLGVRIVFLLYQELLWPPVKKRLEHPERFVLMFAPISRTFEKSYELEGEKGEGPKKALPAFCRNHITLPTSLAENMAFLKGWQDIFQGDGFVYDYPLGRAHYGDLGYVHIAKVLYGDIQKLEEMGLDGYISCQELRAAFPNALPNYVMGRALFQKSEGIEDIIMEYYEACYGKDAQKTLEYLSRLSDLSSCDYVNGKGSRKDQDMAGRMAQAVECCEAFREEILRHGNTQGEYENIYWEILEHHSNYVLLFARALRFLALGEREAASLQWEAMREYICRKEAEYQPYLDVYRVLEVTKHYTGLPL